MAKKRAPAKKKGQIPPPTCKAILLCDQAILEEGTGKTSLIGIFDRIVLSEMPGRSRQCTVFLQLVNGIGAYNIAVEVRDVREDSVLGRAQVASMEFPDRAFRANVLINLPGIPISHPGIYEFVVFADNQEIDRQQLTALLLGDEGYGPDEEDD